MTGHEIMTIPHIELEIKLAVPDAAGLDRLLADPVIVAMAQGEVTDRSFVATYYDTPGFDLLRRRMAFRQREGEGKWRIGIKGGGEMIDGLSRRQEWETTLDHPVTRWGELPPGPLRELILPWVVAEEPLHPLFVTAIQRRVVVVAPGAGCLAEMALDHGRVVAGERVQAVCEVELEWLHGPLEPLQELAGTLLRRHRLAPSRHSKYTLGLSLLGVTAGW